MLVVGVEFVDWSDLISVFIVYVVVVFVILLLVYGLVVFGELCVDGEWVGGRFESFCLGCYVFDCLVVEGLWFCVVGYGC